jgi:hypothetical protein
MLQLASSAGNAFQTRVNQVKCMRSHPQIYTCDDLSYRQDSPPGNCGRLRGTSQIVLFGQLCVKSQSPQTLQSCMTSYFSRVHVNGV